MISIILPTLRVNKNYISKFKELNKNINLDSTPPKLFTDEFIELTRERFDGISHYLDITLKSLESQTYKNFELLLIHKNPDDVKDIIHNYNFKIKVIKEKPSPWNELHGYRTLCNAINTGLIHAEGDLIWRLDDCIYFNNDTAKEINDMWEDGNYITSRAWREIKYDFEKFNYKEPYKRQDTDNKYTIMHKGWSAQNKTLGVNTNKQVKIDKGASWGYSSTVSMEDMIKINGAEELFDGISTGDDIDLGIRLREFSKSNRYISNNYIYEIHDKTNKSHPRIRNNLMMMDIFRRGNLLQAANKIKPTPIMMKRYERWHKANVGELDKEWNTFLKLNQFNLEEARVNKELGDILYEN